MQTATTNYESNPPSALELLFYGSLPGNDRKPDIPSYAIPLAYFPGGPGSPDEAIVAPTSPVETFNKISVKRYSLTFQEGFDFYGISGQTTFYKPDYVSQYPSVSADVQADPFVLSKSKNSQDLLDFYIPSCPIHLVKTIEDSAQSWVPVIKNGLVFRDIIVTQAELDGSLSATGSQNPSEYSSGSWLREAGFSAGDKVRVFYTIPQDVLAEEYSSEGDISHDNLKTIVRVINGEAIHEENGEIVFDTDYITQVESISEISSVGERVIFEDQTVSGTVSTTDFSVTEWFGEAGRLKVIPPPPEGSALITNYKKERFYLEYRGFWDDSAGLWQGLDLNPSNGHTYNTGVDRSTRENLSSEELIYRTVSLYLLPVAALALDADGIPVYPLRYYSAYVEGGKDYRWSPIRHYVQSLARGSSSSTTTGRELASWGYAQFDLDYYVDDITQESANKGIPCNQDSALLIARIKIKPREKTNVEDARRFSGLPGSYDRKSFTGEDKDPRTVRWDTSPWEGLAAPLAGTVLVEVDQAIIDAQGIPTIEEAVNKHLPPGIVAIIRPK